MIVVITFAVSRNEFERKVFTKFMRFSWRNLLYISENIFRWLTGQYFLIFVLSSFLKIGLTWSCLEYLFFDMSQAMILNRWQSVTFADIWKNLAGILSGPVTLFVSKDLIIILLKSLAVGFGISNVLSVLKILFIF